MTHDFGVMPLIIAAQNGHGEVVRCLGGARSQQAGYRLAERVVENIWCTLSLFSYCHLAVFWALLL